MAGQAASGVQRDHRDHLAWMAPSEHKDPQAYQDHLDQWGGSVILEHQALWEMLDRKDTMAHQVCLESLVRQHKGNVVKWVLQVPLVRQVPRGSQGKTEPRDHLGWMVKLETQAHRDGLGSLVWMDWRVHLGRRARMVVTPSTALVLSRPTNDQDSVCIMCHCRGGNDRDEPGK
ncbi:hypothetical protein ANCDUO_12584 [Ancylostoma duodenale]|uniref:Uncharacterized protein n=1 Tax=Ancylostoma duodenale TaxID=51022 RepID=A0A0C2G8B4_9BILA|nr:hypothetical protein ANCDUO_12584 [Ancylostoma duodenale]